MLNPSIIKQVKVFAISYARIVDEPGKGFAFERRAHLIGCLADGCFIADIENERRHLVAELGLQRLGIGFLAHRAEDVKALLGENPRCPAANAGGDTGDNDRFHLSYPCF